MSIFGKHENPLVGHFSYYNNRLFAEHFPHESGGIVFFDIFWPFNESSHTIHVIEGKIEASKKKGDKSWFINGILVRELLHDGGDREFWDEWNRWQEAVKTPHGQKMVNNREFVHELARSYGALV